MLQHACRLMKQTEERCGNAPGPMSLGIQESEGRSAEVELSLSEVAHLFIQVPTPRWSGSMDFCSCLISESRVSMVGVIFMASIPKQAGMDMMDTSRYIEYVSLRTHDGSGKKCPCLLGDESSCETNKSPLPGSSKASIWIYFDLYKRNIIV